MSNLGIAGFDVYKKDNCMGCKTPTRKDLEEYFESVFYHKPTMEQLDIFHKYLIGIESDAEKVLDVCCNDRESSENANQMS